MVNVYKVREICKTIAVIFFVIIPFMSETIWGVSALVFAICYGLYDYLKKR